MVKLMPYSATSFWDQSGLYELNQKIVQLILNYTRNKIQKTTDSFKQNTRLRQVSFVIEHQQLQNLFSSLQLNQQKQYQKQNFQQLQCSKKTELQIVKHSSNNVNLNQMKTILFLVLVFAFIEFSACFIRPAILKCGQFLASGQYLQSTNGYYLVMQSDCNLVIYRSMHFVPRNALWASGTNINGCILPKFVNQNDGNLVIYNGNNPIWSSRTNSGTKCYQLIMQDDGNLVLYTADFFPIWATGTNA